MKLNTLKVKEIMQNKGLTASDLAKIMGIHRQTVYETLYGKTGRTFKTIARLARALHVNEKDLVE